MRNAFGWSLGIGIVALGCGGGDGGGPADSGPGCGDGIMQTGEECDDGAANSDTEPGACRTTCRLATCGDGILDTGEDCDDGSANSDTTPDACRTSCDDPACGDEVTDDGEQCDDGNDNADEEPDACREDCVSPACGDGVTDTGEECDDADTVETNECRNDCTSTAIWTQLDDLGTGGIALDVAVDASDNIVVVGYTIGTGGSFDVWLRKYDASGATLWTRTHDGAAGGDDFGYGVAVDAAGNVFAAGAESTAAGDLDAWIRGYDAGGNTLWTQTYDGPGNGDDIVARIGTDGAGNAFVVGTETAAGGDADVWIRKYDASGTPQWTDSIDESGDDDQGAAVAVDGAGNVLALASLTDAAGGGITWVRKYDNDGAPLWLQTYSSADDPFDIGLGVAVDGGGNVLLTGLELQLTTLGAWIGKLAPDGSDTWSRLHQAESSSDFLIGYDVAADGDGNVLVAATVVYQDDTSDFATLKYDATGTEVWERILDLEDTDLPYGVAADAAGNVIVVGATFDATGTPSIVVRKYEP